MRLFVRPDVEARVDTDNTWLDAATWVLLDDEGEIRSQGSGNPMPLADLAGGPALAEPGNVVLVLPAERCLATQCVVPGRSAGQIRRALPFVVEEFLAADLDAVHIATGPIRRQAPVDVVAIDRGLLRGWVDALAGLGFVPGHACADAALLPAPTSGLCVLFDGPRALLRGTRQWLAIDSDSLPAALTAAFADFAPDTEVDVELVNGDISAIERAALEQSSAAKVVWRAQETDVPGLIHLARGYVPGAAVDLLTGEFAPPRRRSVGWQRWRAVAALVAVWLVVGVIATAARGFWAESRANALAAESEALYRSYFPNDRRIQDVYRQMSAHLGRGGGAEDGAIAFVGELSRVVSASAGVGVRSLAFSGDRSELSAEVSVPGFDALDQIKSALGGRGFDVEIASAEQQDQGVLARLRIRSMS
jgi:general secretion pathway protein L